MRKRFGTCHDERATNSFNGNAETEALLPALTPAQSKWNGMN